MLIARLILAGTAAVVLVRRPMSARATVGLVALGLIDLLVGARAGPVIGVIGPLVVFLAAALTLAGMIERSGLARRTALALARSARGSVWGLYALVCVACLILTAAVSLDGAVVLMVPLLLGLAGRVQVPLRPLFLGVVVVANTASIAVPQGNPTNLVLIARLGLSPTRFASHMLIPGLAAAALCAAAVAVTERRALSGVYRPPASTSTRLSARERRALIALIAAALGAFLAPLAGIAPWWPFAGVVATAVLAERSPLTVPWRITAQIGALVILIAGTGIAPPALPGGILGQILVTGAMAALAALVNNLPASVWSGSLLAGHSAYAASIGLAIGPLATPHGSVATLLALDLAGDAAPALPTRRLAGITAATLAATTLILWTGI
jgi:Na+/H+ antiporter NhaD/arsenite permease-like protein